MQSLCIELRVQVLWTFVDSQNASLDFVLLHVLHKLNQIDLVAVNCGVDIGRCLDLQNTLSVEAICVHSQVTVDNTIRNKVGVIDQIDVVTDFRLQYMTILGVAVAREGILSKLCFF